MAHQYGIIAQGASIDHTVGEGKQVVAGLLSVCNTDDADHTFTVTTTKSGGSATEAYKDNPIAAKDTKEILRGLCLAAGDNISCDGSDAAVKFTICGDEVS